MLPIEPIGQVRQLSDGEAVLEIDPRYREGLDGLTRGARIQVLYWMHALDADARRVLKVHPRGDKSRPRRGVFTLRSPMRPNPIGVSTVEVLRVEDNRVVVGTLDALDGSPIIDVKMASGK